MKIKSFLLVFLCLCLLLSLCSCVEEEMPETLEMPELGTLIEYRISENECFRVLFDDYYTNFGEWVKDGETTKVLFRTEEDYWGLLFSRYGITELRIYVSEFTLDGKYENGGYALNAEKDIACTDEGFLNSTTFTMLDTGEVLQITDIVITENYEGDFDWATPEWKEFCAPAENTSYEIEQLSLRCDSATKAGEWITNGVSVPVKIVFDEWVCSVEIFDVSSGEEKRIFFGNGHMEDGVLVIDTCTSDMFYANTVTDLKITKTVTE